MNNWLKWLFRGGILAGAFLLVLFIIILAVMLVDDLNLASSIIIVASLVFIVTVWLSLD